MAFPTSLDSFTNPNATDQLNTPPHHTQHSNENDAIVAIETKVGIDASTPIANSVLAGTASGHSSFSTTPTLASLSLTDHLDLTEEAAPAVSAAGKARVYADTGHVLYASINGVAYKKIIRTGDDFVASGVSHASGLVPDPGVIAGTTKFLREDATWQTITFPVANSRTAYASRPAAGNSGRLWQSTDSIFEAFDDGVNWQESVFGQQVKSTGGFPTTWANQPTGATQDVTKGGLIFRCIPTTPATTINNALIEKTVPGTPGTTPYILTVAIIPAFTPYKIVGTGEASYWQGIMVRDSASGKFIDFQITNHTFHNGVTVDVNEWNSPSSFAATIGTWQIHPISIMWLRIQDTGANRIFSISYDGINFNTLLTHANTTWITANKFGFSESGYFDGSTDVKDTIGWYVSWDVA